MLYIWNEYNVICQLYLNLKFSTIKKIIIWWGEGERWLLFSEEPSKKGKVSQEPDVITEQFDYKWEIKNPEGNNQIVQR